MGSESRRDGRCARHGACPMRCLCLSRPGLSRPCSSLVVADGSEYVNDLMVYWLASASAGPLAEARTETLTEAEAIARLPPVLNSGHGLQKQMRATTACYFVHADGTRQTADGVTTWMVVPWEPAVCQEDLEEDASDATALAHACRVMPQAHCPPIKSYEATLAHWHGSWPLGWLYCDRTIAPQRRQMKNLAAFTAGALVYLSVAMPAFLALRAGTASAELRLLHLISYEHMGIARVSCVAGCTCESRVWDAHRIVRRRNVSIYVEAALPVTFSVPSEPANGGASPRCKLALRVLGRTSSGEHRWVIARLTVTSGVATGGRGGRVVDKITRRTG
jgi:hypothetical protein